MKISRKTIEEFWRKNCPDSKNNLLELKKINSKITPFIGAGMSVNYKLPTWYNFLTEIINSKLNGKEKRECKKLLDDGKYLEVATKVDILLNHSVSLLVSNTFSYPKIELNQKHYILLLKSLGIKSFVTTNYDEVIEKTYSLDGKGDLHCYLPNTGDIRYTYQDACRLNYPRLLKLHGTCTNQKSIVLTKDQYSKCYNEKSKMKSILKELWTQETLLFLGCSLFKDPLIQQLYHRAGDNPNIFHYAILGYPNDPAERLKIERWITELHIKPIWYPQNEHNAVLVILEMLCNGWKVSKSKDEKTNPSKPLELSTKDISYRFLDPIAKKAFEEKKGSGLYNSLMELVKIEGGAAKPRIKDLCTKLLCSSCNLSIEGDPGTGKSTLLSLLYFATKQEVKDSKRKVGLFLVDLHFFEMMELSEAKSQLMQVLSDAYTMLTINDKIVLFIDGINYYLRTHSELEHILLTTLSSWYENDVFREKTSTIYSCGVMNKEFSYFDSFKPNKPNLPCSCTYRIKLNYIDVCSSEFSKIVNTLMKVEQIFLPDKDKGKCFLEKFRTYCLKVSGNYTELRTVHFLILNYANSREALFNLSVGKLFYDFYSNEFEKLSIKMEDVAKNVTHYLLDRECLSSKLPPTFYVYKSPTVRDFFLALHYIESIKNKNMSEIRLFNHIFTLRINRYIVSILNLSPVSERSIVSSSIEIFDSLFLPQKNQLVYMLGRTKSKMATKLASEFLYGVYEAERKKVDKYVNDEEMMLFRSVGISLLYLDNNKYLDDFLELTMYNQRLSRVNRNFHVRYYEKIKSRLEDELRIDNCDCCSPNQLLDLYNHLYLSIRSSNRQSLRYISIITLLNLVVYNHYLNYPQKHDGFNPKNFEKFLDEMCNDVLITNTIVKEYILNIRDYITSPNVYSNLLDNIYKLKDIVRTGWTRPDRRIQNPEEVSSHSWSACMLAQIFLADRLAECTFASDEEKATYRDQYDKSHILKLLLVHDLAEMYIGDITPDSSAYATKDNKERTIFKQMKALASFPNLSSFIDISDLGKEFIEGNTINSQIANDFDQLDAIVQVYAYRNRFPIDTREEVKDEWIKYIDGKLRTTLGRNLFAFIRSNLLDYDYSVDNKTISVVP